MNNLRWTVSYHWMVWFISNISGWSERILRNIGQTSPNSNWWTPEIGQKKSPKFRPVARKLTPPSLQNSNWHLEKCQNSRRLPQIVPRISKTMAKFQLRTQKIGKELANSNWQPPKWLQLATARFKMAAVDVQTWQLISKQWRMVEASPKTK